MALLLLVGNHFLDGGNVGDISVSGGAQTAGTLGVLLGEDMALVSAGSLDLTGLGQVKSLLCTGICLLFWHFFSKYNTNVVTIPHWNTRDLDVKQKVGNKKPIILFVGRNFLKQEKLISLF